MCTKEGMRRFLLVGQPVNSDGPSNDCCKGRTHLPSHGQACEDQLRPDEYR